MTLLNSLSLYLFSNRNNIIFLLCSYLVFPLNGILHNFGFSIITNLDNWYYRHKLPKGAKSIISSLSGSLYAAIQEVIEL
jgi:hypothetical protein